MPVVSLPPSLFGARTYMVGIKGTGMAALAEILVAAGVGVEGSDTEETFYTDEVLQSLGVTVHEGFSPANLPPAPDLVIYSAAYDPRTHPELLAAAERGVPLRSYTEALGDLSRLMPSVGIAGVHGKTTTAAMVAMIVRATGMPGIVLAGSALPDLGVRSTLVQGSEFFVAETCEYRRNFLSFSPSIIVVTSVEADHLDYFRDAEDVMRAFAEYVMRLPDGGELIYCADDAGARGLAAEVAAERPDVALTPYGVQASGDGAVTGVRGAPGELAFTLPSGSFSLHIPGRHNVLNAAAAILVADRLRTRYASQVVSEPGVSGTSGDGRQTVFADSARAAVASFRGTRRRSEVVGEAGGVLIMDDYAHHPTAITATLAGLREFYPHRRIVLDFMSHTYSRTEALLPEFARAVTAADVVILHDIYASARERYSGGVTGETLFREACRHSESVHYVPGVMDALPLAEGTVRPGDLFLTMGAGNNWQLGRALYDLLVARETVS